MDENLAHELAVESFKFELDYSSIKCIVIVGRRGAGKTQLAYFFVEEFKKQGITVHIIEDGLELHTSGEHLRDKIRRVSEDRLIFVTQAIGFLDLGILSREINLIVDADIVKFDRSLGFYGHYS